MPAFTTCFRAGRHGGLHPTHVGRYPRDSYPTHVGSIPKGSHPTDVGRNSNKPHPTHVGRNPKGADILHTLVGTLRNLKSYTRR